MKKVLQIVFLVLLVILVSSCTSKDLNPIVKPADVPVVNVPSPAPVNLPRPELQVLNSDGVHQLSTKLKKSPDPNFNIYTMDYATLEKFLEALNKVADYIDAKQAEVDYYKTYLNSLKEKDKTQN